MIYHALLNYPPDLSRTTVLSIVRNLVAAPDFTAAPAELSDYLQLLDVDGHTPIYWATVNCSQEAISAYTALISSSQFCLLVPPTCASHAWRSAIMQCLRS
jgi:hypothetical protein